MEPPVRGCEPGAFFVKLQSRPRALRPAPRLPFFLTRRKERKQRKRRPCREHVCREWAADIHLQSGPPEQSSVAPERGPDLLRPPPGREFLPATGTALQVRNLTRVNHCARFPFTTGPDGCATGISTAFWKNGRVEQACPTPVERPFLHTLWASKEYVAVGGRDPLGFKVS